MEHKNPSIEVRVSDTVFMSCIFCETFLWVVWVRGHNKHPSTINEAIHTCMSHTSLDINFIFSSPATATLASKCIFGPMPACRCSHGSRDKFVVFSPCSPHLQTLKETLNRVSFPRGGQSCVQSSVSLDEFCKEGSAAASIELQATDKSPNAAGTTM